MSPQMLLQQIKNRYPVAEKTIPLIASQICMAIVDDPDQLLDTLSKEDQWGILHLPIGLTCGPLQSVWHNILIGVINLRGTGFRNRLWVWTRRDCGVSKGRHRSVHRL